MRCPGSFAAGSFTRASKHKKAFQTIPTMITLTFINLLKLPLNRECRIMPRPLLVHSLFQAVVFDTGTLHHASQHRTSLLFMWEQTHKVGCFEARRFICALEGRRVLYPLTPRKLNG